MYRAAYAISAQSSKQWPHQCREQFSSCPSISGRRSWSACRNWLSPLEQGPYLQCHIQGGVTLQHSTWNKWAQVCRKGRDTAFPALQFPSPSTLGNLCYPAQWQMKWQPPLLTTVSVRNQVFPYIMLKNELPSLPETIQPGTESSKLISVLYHRYKRSQGQGAWFPSKPAFRKSWMPHFQPQTCTIPSTARNPEYAAEI